MREESSEAENGLGNVLLNLRAGEATLGAYGVRGHSYTALVAPEGELVRTYVGHVASRQLGHSVRIRLGLE